MSSLSELLKGDFDSFLARKPVRPGVCALCGSSEGEIIWYATVLDILSALGVRVDGDCAHRDCVKVYN